MRPQQIFIQEQKKCLITKTFKKYIPTFSTYLMIKLQIKFTLRIAINKKKC